MINQKRITLTFAFAYLLISNANISCGTLGAKFGIIDFPISKKKLEIGIDSFFSKNPEYAVPGKWISDTNWVRSGYGFLESRTFYFKSQPEEMYWVTFVGDSAMLADPGVSRIAISAIFNITGRWIYGKDINDIELQRVRKRFQYEIISKIEQYTKTAATME
jgi:hypothetical protein